MDENYLKGSTHITNSKEARTQRRQAILDENEYYEATEGILYGAGIFETNEPIIMTFLPHILYNYNYSAHQGHLKIFIFIVFCVCRKR